MTAAHLEFTSKLIPYDGDDVWVDGTLSAIGDILNAPEPPALDEDREYCRFAARAASE